MPRCILDRSYRARVNPILGVCFHSYIVSLYALAHRAECTTVTSASYWARERGTEPHVIQTSENRCAPVFARGVTREETLWGAGTRLYI